MIRAQEPEPITKRDPVRYSGAATAEKGFVLGHARFSDDSFCFAMNTNSSVTQLLRYSNDLFVIFFRIAPLVAFYWGFKKSPV